MSIHEMKNLYTEIHILVIIELMKFIFDLWQAVCSIGLLKHMLGTYTCKTCAYKISIIE